MLRHLVAVDKGTPSNIYNSGRGSIVAAVVPAMRLALARLRSTRLPFWQSERRWWVSDSFWRENGRKTTQRKNK